MSVLRTKLVSSRILDSRAGVELGLTVQVQLLLCKEEALRCQEIGFLAAGNELAINRRRRGSKRLRLVREARGGEGGLVEIEI